MIRNDSRSGKRSAFTLVELLVVILIIAILVSLISSAVMMAMDRIPEVKTRTEIAEMDVALRAFMTDYNVTYPPPSRLYLYENISLYLIPANSANPFVAQSYSFLQQAFGKTLGPVVDWNGNNQIDGPDGLAATMPWTLEGEECLVFYLGGIPNLTAGPQGFSTNNMKPSYGSMPGEVPGKRKGPYFTFDLTRLKPATRGGFMLYVDPWQSKTSQFYAILGGTPYAYFSSRGTNNAYIAADCSQIGAAPYYVAAGQYTNPNSYQIISAGKNGVFGNGFWSPAAGPLIAGTVPPQPDPNGADDQANFSAGLLGKGQQ